MDKSESVLVVREPGGHMDCGDGHIRPLVNSCGMLSTLQGVMVPITFSLYGHHENSSGGGNANWAEGMCRVSDGSAVLEELFDLGAPLLLRCIEMEVPVLLTSPYTFDVTGPVVEKAS